jgi:hypothetical protein
MSSQQAQSKREMPIAEVVRLIDLVTYQRSRCQLDASQPCDGNRHAVCLR